MKNVINTLQRHSSPALAPLGVIACATNPVAGRRELSLVSESQEITMGLQAADAVKTSMGVVEDAALQQYVTGLGMPMAKASERPTLPWTFTVVDGHHERTFAVVSRSRTIRALGPGRECRARSRLRARPPREG